MNEGENVLASVQTAIEKKMPLYICECWWWYENDDKYAQSNHK